MNRTMTFPIEREQQEPAVARRISPAALIRQSGLLAIAAGVSLIVGTVIHPEEQESAAWVPVHLLYFGTLMVVLLALIGIFARQLQPAGRLGVAGFLTAFLGTAMVLLEGREHLFSPDFGDEENLRGLWQLIVTSVVFSAGYIMLGVAIARVRVLPRVAGILLAVGGPLVAFSPPMPVYAVVIIASTLFGVGLAWVGYALWTEPDAEREQPAIAFQSRA